MSNVDTDLLDRITDATAPKYKPKSVGPATALVERLAGETPRFPMPRREGCVKVTPEIAEDWLRRNTFGNRKIIERFVATLVRVIEDGEFMDNGDTVRFSANGELLDGQHRLAAIVLSGRTVYIYIRLNIDERAFLSMDTGNRRRAQDHLSMRSDVPYPTALAAAARTALMELATGTILAGRFQPTITEVVDFVDASPLLCEVAADVQKHKQPRGLLRSAGNAIWLIWRLRTIDPVRARDFIDALSTGTHLGPDSPILWVRNFLIDDARSSKKRTPEHLLAIVVKCWNLLVTNGEWKGRFNYGKADGGFPAIATPGDRPKKARKKSAIKEAA